MFVRNARLALLAAAAICSLSGTAQALSFLTILHNSDAESQLLPTEIAGQQYGGAARFVTAMRTLRDNAIAAGRNVLTLSSGDNFLAGPEFNASLANGVYYDAQVINAIGYDAVVIGNHEFDFGPARLADFIAATDSSIPFLSANLDFSANAELQALVEMNRIAPATIVTRGSERYAIVGATTEDLPTVSSPGNVQIEPVVGAVQAQIDRLTNEEGITKIIFASHLQNLEVDRQVLAQLRGVDIVIAGGSSTLLRNDIPVGGTDIFGQTVAGAYPQTYQDAAGMDVPVVTTPGDYRYIGQLNATFSTEGVLLSVDTGSNAILVNEAFAPDQTILDTVVTPVQDSIAALAANVIGVSEVDLNGRRNDIRSRQTNLGAVIADAFIYQAQQLDQADGSVLTGRAVVSITNGGGIRNDSIIPMGEITELDTFDILPFSNFLAVFNDVSVLDLRQILEFSIGRAPGSSGRFGQVGGLSFAYNPNRAVGDRILSITLEDGTVLFENGAVLFDGKLDLVTNSFTAGGGDDYPFAALGLDFENYGRSYQQALFNFIQDDQGLNGVIGADRYGAAALGRIAAVPEPASWAMLIAGFGLIGGALRARRAVPGRARAA